MNQNQSISKIRRDRRARSLRTIFIGLVVLLLTGYLAVGAVSADRLTRVYRRSTQDTPLNYGMSYEDVVYPARDDGLEISGWYISCRKPGTESTPAIVMVHGKNSSRTWEFDQYFLDVAQALHQAGSTVLLIDLRGHGQSAESRFSFGLYERRDVLGAVDYLISRGHQPGKIGLLGSSMGAASVIGAAVEDKAVGAVFTDSLFADVYPIIQDRWVHDSGLPTIFLYPTRWMSRLLLGYDMANSRPIDEIGQIARVHC
jgi:pimeloyl-ACP methyl ester carboxylesterase